ncbi:LAO/AO transport system kinase [Candidatus Kryptonium thompsonii]|uniref:LAO/AO transport system kinase n=1 Tax=Candidatus Kryptonium thompsonii TaxID=1633631 RepID=A0A0P1MLL5_9BACT|nr:LAO/AO transport system kinase [Candidatus Kryptonium thompsoni]CUS79810.1 LAO/AO transport system kinase [Candidatus Kryptonium thompsoni]CUS83644.1 LAO/AO transport system kinase [Candidatus Kryptonium thompsoni]CUS84182.1 LAO/AO transport system kinase [Candidatus Kryptonium thompsoni]CUS84920.1 LAO/AO transport system kinase [Candidatus Kryptonium thompsoni]
MVLEFVQKITDGNFKAISKAISLVENEHDEAKELLKKIYKYTGKAYKVGITGPPGAGKSTLVFQLTKLLRNEGKKVGIIAVDPTSPFTGGSLLGDRVRMSELALDDGVFIRSMATRGSLGGLSKKAIEAGDILDAAGFDYVIFETVGVGQSELDIVKAADTVVVVLVPESGDSIQAMKAGLMEIADIFVLNKSDREGADIAANAIKSVLSFRMRKDEWEVEVIKTIGNAGFGVDTLLNQIKKHRDFLFRTGEFEKRRKEKLKSKIKEIVEERLRENFWTRDRVKLLDERISSITNSHINPIEIAEELIAHFYQQNSL